MAAARRYGSVQSVRFGLVYRCGGGDFSKRGLTTPSLYLSSRSSRGAGWQLNEIQRLGAASRHLVSRGEQAQTSSPALHLEHDRDKSSAGCRPNACRDSHGSVLLS